MPTVQVHQTSNNVERRVLTMTILLSSEKFTKGLPMLS